MSPGAELRRVPLLSCDLECYLLRELLLRTIRGSHCRKTCLAASGISIPIFGRYNPCFILIGGEQGGVTPCRRLPAPGNATRSRNLRCCQRCGERCNLRRILAAQRLCQSTPSCCAVTFVLDVGGLLRPAAQTCQDA